jgi:hypothetical protein
VAAPRPRGPSCGPGSGYHGVRWFAPAHLREEPQAAGRAYEGGTMFSVGNVETPEGEVSPYKTDDEDGKER